MCSGCLGQQEWVITGKAGPEQAYACSGPRGEFDRAQWVTIPASHTDLLTGPYYAVFTTIAPSGQAENTVVWCSWDGSHVLVNTASGRRKHNNVLQNPLTPRITERTWYNGVMNSESSLTRVDRSAFAVTDLGEDASDLQYWLARTPQERLQHIERLRRINYGYRASGRLQRVLEVVELASS